MFLNAPPLRRVGTWATAGLVLFLSAMVLKDWYFPRIEYFQVTPPPVVLRETKFSERVKTVTVKVPVQAKEPTEKQAKKLLPTIDLEKVHWTGEFEIPVAPDGGKVQTTIDKTTGQQQAHFQANDRSFFDLSGPAEIGLGAGLRFDQELQQVFAAYGQKDLARTGRVTWRARLDVEAYRSSTDVRVVPQATLWAVWRF